MISTYDACSIMLLLLSAAVHKLRLC